MTFGRLFLSVALITSIWGCGSSGNNPLTLIDGDATQTGFAIYRSGQPVTADLKTFCAAGGRSIFALNGLGREYANTLKEICPAATIVYDQEQDADSGVDHNFLERFDTEVQKAQNEGYKVLFHCNCGCHRTGRLAAYYRMKYNGWSSSDAIKEMNQLGKDMDKHPTLTGQVRAMEDYIHGRACSQKAANCVQ